MRLKGRDRVSHYLRLCDLGLVSADNYNNHLNYFGASDFGNLYDWDIDTYQGLLNCATDPEKVTYLYTHHYKGLWGLWGRWKLAHLSIADYFGAVAYLKHGIEQVTKMFEAIPKPEVSPAIAEIMKQNSDFGFYGIIDRLAQRQGISDDEAGKIPIIIAIAKLRIDAEQSIARQRIEQYNLAQIKNRRK